jgi:hypothetical protein
MRSFVELLDYYLGELSSEEAAEELEEHLFTCEACSSKLDAIHRMAASIVALVRRGEVSSGGTTALLNRMARDRLNLRHYIIQPGETVACTVGKDDDFMVGHFVLPQVEKRIDMRVLDASDNEMMRVDDIVIDVRAQHAIMFIPSRPVQTEESAVWHYVLVGEDEREVGRYSMDHTALREA